MTPRACTLTLLLAWQPAAPCLDPFALRAQDPPGLPPRSLEIPGDDAPGRRVLRLAIEDCIGLGLVGSTDLAEARLLPAMRRAEVRAAEAFFEPELFAEAGAARRETPARSDFQPTSTVETYDATLGLRQRVITGALLELAFSPVRVRQDVDSPFQFPQRFYTAEWSARMVQPLLRGAWMDYTTAAVVRARIEDSSAANDYEATVQRTMLGIIETYWDLVFARADYRVRAESQALAREQLRITEERIRTGLLAERDRIADEADVARREEELISAENRIRVAEDALRRRIFPFHEEAEDWEARIIPTSDFEADLDVEVPSWTEAARVALASRPDLVRLRNEVDQAELEMMQARRDLLPRLDLVGVYGSDSFRDSFGPAVRDALKTDFPDYAVRLEMVLPLGNTEARARVDRSSFRLEQAKRALRNGELDVVQAVRAAVWDVETLLKVIHAGQETVRLAASNLETERSRLEVGRSTAFEVQRRNQELAEARSSLIRAMLDLQSGLARVRQVQGLLTPGSIRGL